jgi:prepilin-type N-terminal cleavage/methylation domain-containing protein
MTRGLVVRQVGFTLIELVVVLAIVGAFLGMLYPAVSKMTASSRLSGAVDTIGVTVPAARAYATRGIASLGEINPTFAGASYSGTAVIFTPAGELRIVENDQAALNMLNQPLEPSRNGYADIPDFEYVKLPKGVGVVGISANASGTDPDFLPPPFAIRFTEEGYLITGTDLGVADERLVHYDGNVDDQYRLSGNGVNRNSPYPSGGTYDVDKWDPESSEYTPSNDTSNNPGINPVVDKYKLPFEEMETVVGVLVYSKAAFREAGLNWGTSTPATINAWLGAVDANGKLVNARPLFFSRYSGQVFRE